MKKQLIGLVISLLLFSFYSHAQEMKFLSGGKVSYQDKIIQKPSELLPIISQKNSPEIMTAFDKYKSNRGISSVFGFIGGFGIGYSLGGLIGGKKIDGGLIAGGAGMIGIGFIFSGASNNALKQVIELYNGTSPTKVSIQPIFNYENSINQIGISVGF